MVVCSHKHCENWETIGKFMVIMDQYDSKEQKKIICPVCGSPAIELKKHNKPLDDDA